ncbi:MAG: NAD(+)/NADH kinase [Halanaerobiales bacterium]
MKHIISWKGVDIIPRIGLVLNTQKDKAFTVADRVIKYLSERDISFLVETRAAEIMGRSEKADYSKLRSDVEYIVIIGGDGTFLHTAHYFFGSGIPLLGINIGHLGFLTEIETNELEKALGNLFAGKFSIEKRMILEGNIESDGENVYHNFALNDFVVHRGSRSKLVGIDFYINDEIVNSYRADGIIVSTPTGSTAYSLSSGGPIINPQIRAIIVTPICPHSLFITPMVISDREKLKIVVHGEYTMSFTADGGYDYSIKSNDEINVQAASRELLVVKLPGSTFYSILHKKMKAGLV